MHLLLLFCFSHLVLFLKPMEVFAYISLLLLLLLLILLSFFFCLYWFYILVT